MPGKPKTNSVGSQVKRKVTDDSIQPTKSKKQKKVSTLLPPNCKTFNLSPDEINIGVQSDPTHLHSDENDGNLRPAHNLSVDITYTSTASQTSTPTDDLNRCEELHISLDVSQRASDLVDRIMSLIDCEEEADESEPVVAVNTLSEQNTLLLQQGNELQQNEPPVSSPVKALPISVDKSHSSVMNFYGLNRINASSIQNVTFLKKQNASGNMKNKRSHDEVNSETHLRRSKKQILHERKIKSQNDQGATKTLVSNDLQNINEAPISNQRLSNESLSPDQSGKSPLSVVYALPLKEVIVAPCVNAAFDKIKHFNGIKLTPKKMASGSISMAIDVDVDRVQANADPSKLIENIGSCVTNVSSKSLLQGLSNDQSQQTKSNMRDTSTGDFIKIDIIKNSTNLIEKPSQIHKKRKPRNLVSSPPDKTRRSSALNSNSVSQAINKTALANSVDITMDEEAGPLSRSEDTSQYSRKAIELVTPLSTSVLANKDFSATRSTKQYKESFTALLQPSSYSSLGSGPIPPPHTGKKYVGAHVSAAGGIHKVFENAEIIKASSFAMFMRNQRQWVAKPFEEEHLQLFRQRAKGFPMHLILPHGSYLMNVGSSNPELLQKSRVLLTEELLRCNQLNVPHFNFHPGSCVGGSGRDDCCRTIAESINRAHSEVPRVIVVLENMCRQGNTIGGDFHELRRIIELVDDRSRVGVCLDTCHAHNAGYDLSTEEGFNEMVHDFDTIIGFQFLRGLHINDSKNAAGAHVDRHEGIGKGNIGIEGMRRVMNCPHFDDLPIILETPFTDDAGYAREIKLLQGLIGAGGAAKEEASGYVEGKVQDDGEGEGEQEVVPAVNSKWKSTLNVEENPAAPSRGRPSACGKGQSAVSGKLKLAVPGRDQFGFSVENEPAVNVKLASKGEMEVNVSTGTKTKLSAAKNKYVEARKLTSAEQPSASGKSRGRGRPKKQPVTIDLKSDEGSSGGPAESAANKLVKTGPTKQKPTEQNILNKQISKPSANGKSRGRGRPKKQSVLTDQKSDRSSSGAPAEC